MNGKTQIVAIVLGFVVVLGFGFLMYQGMVGQWIGFGGVALGVGVMFPVRLKQAAEAIAKLVPFGKK